MKWRKAISFSSAQDMISSAQLPTHDFSGLGTLLVNIRQYVKYVDSTFSGQVDEEMILQYVLRALQLTDRTFKITRGNPLSLENQFQVRHTLLFRSEKTEEEKQKALEDTCQFLTDMEETDRKFGNIPPTAPLSTSSAQSTNYSKKTYSKYPTIRHIAYIEESQQVVENDEYSVHERSAR